MTINEKIQNLRMQLGLTQKEFGEIIGVSKNTISRWEQPNSSVPYSKQVKICKAFNVKTSVIFDDEVIENFENRDNKEIVYRIKNEYLKLSKEDKAEVLRLILSNK